MYPDQVARIRERQHQAATLTDAKLYRRDQAAIHLATRYRYRSASEAEQSAIEYWIEHGGRRPWGI